MQCWLAQWGALPRRAVLTVCFMLLLLHAAAAATAATTLRQILDETSAAVAALEAQQWRASTERSLEYARSLAAKAAVTLQVRAQAFKRRGLLASFIISFLGQQELLAAAEEKRGELLRGVGAFPSVAGAQACCQQSPWVCSSLAHLDCCVRLCAVRFCAIRVTRRVPQQQLV